MYVKMDLRESYQALGHGQAPWDTGHGRGIIATGQAYFADPFAPPTRLLKPAFASAKPSCATPADGPVPEWDWTSPDLRPAILKTQMVVSGGSP